MATATSRILGFVRDILVAGAFGTGAAIQAFIVAFRIPNLMRHMVAEGAASSAFVPVLSEYLANKKREEFWDLVNVLLNLILASLMLIVVIGIFAAPVIVRIIAPGFTTDHYQLNLAIGLTRTIFPYILLIGLAAYAMGILNSLKHFSLPAFAPAFLNIAIISAILLCRPNVSVSTLAFAVLVGGALQLAIQIPMLYKKGMRLKWPLSFRHPAAKKVGLLLLPRTLSAAVYQLNVLIDTMLASLHWIVGAGGIAALWFSNRLIQFPTAVFGTSLATAALPNLSQQFARGEIDKFKETINFLLKAMFLIMIPATIGIMVLGLPIVRVLFERGEFTPYSTSITHTALLFYAFGLFSYPGIKIMVYSFYSMQDTMTPVKTASIALFINVILNVILMWPLKIGGLALATSIAGIFNFSYLLFMLKRRLGSLEGAHMTRFLIKVIVAALGMGGILYMGLGKLNTLITGAGFFASFGYILVYILGGLIIYLTILYLLRLSELGKFIRWILRKR